MVPPDNDLERWFSKAGGDETFRQPLPDEIVRPLVPADSPDEIVGYVTIRGFVRYPTKCAIISGVE